MAWPCPGSTPTARSESAAEIRSLVASSGATVSAGVKLVSEMGQSIETILAQITAAAEKVRDIAMSAGEQATATTEINSGIAMLDEVTQQNAAMAEQSAAALLCVVMSREKTRHE